MPIAKPPELKEIPLPPEPGLLRGWGRKLELTLLRFILSTYNTVMSPFWEARDVALKYLFQTIEDELKPVIEPLLDTIEANPDVPQWMRNMTQHLRFSEPITFALIAVSFIVAAVGSLIGGLAGPIQRIISQEADSYIHSARMTPNEAFAALRRKAISPEEYHNHLSDGGWSEELEATWQKILAPLVSVGDIGQVWLREEISEGEFDNQLQKRGYEPEEIAHIKVLLQVIPPLPDIIRMAVREAFTPDIVQTFQLHAELPPELLSWARKQGLSEEWSRAYWASHWVLPPLTLGYEMLHRGEITETEMKLLIKAHDVSPFWRDKLLNISYAPYTRVDVRRMLDVGTIERGEVKRTYLDLGYNEERAENLTQFAVDLTMSTERDLTKTDILNGFETGYFQPGEVDELMAGLGYSQDEIDYYKYKIQYKRWKKMVSETVKYIQQRYVLKQIEQDVVYSELGALNLPAEQMNRYILEWDIKRNAKVRRLTAAQLEKFRKQEVIGDSEFTNEMSGLGYNNRYIQWWLESIKGK